LGKPSREERVWVDRIEQVRASLADSQTPLTITDFGAGKRTSDGVEQGESQDAIVRTLGDMTASSKPARWAYLLFRLIRQLEPESCLELGACVGISAGYQAAALELNGAGRLLSLEGAEVLAARSSQTLEELGLSDRASVRQGAFAATLPGALADLRPLDWVFVDGHHVEEATIEYTELIVPALSGEAVVVYDDINWSPGMQRAWARIEADPRFSLTVDLRTVGLAVVSGVRPTGRRNLSIPYG